jgi:hypothetical protein
MAVCEYCELEMNGAAGCVKMPVRTVDGELDPIPYGSETRYPPPPEGHRCHDCDALPGNYHHVGCDWEECPRCHGQYITCGCQLGEVESEDTEQSQEKNERTEAS